MAIEKAPEALRTIGEVAQELGVATHVLRFWESKFRQIKPRKRRGRRYYRPEDVEIVTKIKSLLYSHGYTIRGVQKVLSGDNTKAAADLEASTVVIAGDSGVSNGGKDLFGNKISDNDNMQDNHEAQGELLGEVMQGLKKVRQEMCYTRDKLKKIVS